MLEFLLIPLHVSIVDSVFRIGEFAECVGRSIGMAWRWEAEGRITLPGGPTGHRYVDDTDMRQQAEHVAARNGCTILIDLLAIVRVFLYRLNGLRQYEKALCDELTGVAG